MILFSVDQNETDICTCEITLMPTEFVEHRCFHATHVHWQKRRSQHEIYGFREENMRPFIRREWQWTNEITSTCFYPANRLRLPSLLTEKNLEITCFRMLSERLRKASNRVRETIFLFRRTIYFAIVYGETTIWNIRGSISTSNSRTENECFFGKKKKKEIYIENMQMMSIIVSKWPDVMLPRPWNERSLVVRVSTRSGDKAIMLSSESKHWSDGYSVWNLLLSK